MSTFNYLPSFIMNVLKFRFGVIPSLSDTEFQRYKEGPDHPTLVFGIAFWSQLFAATISFGLFGLVGFFVSWNESSDFVLTIIAQMIGISVTIIFKIIAIVLFRQNTFGGFYRKKVAVTNIVFAIFESWNIAITVGFLVVRSALLFVLAVLYIGRIDTPFLAEEVDKFDFLPNAAYMDRAPVYYRKDLLIHEAHRHPYIERLASLYLLKLNLGDSFATRAGSAWRLLYALTLMPWLRKYRANARSVNFVAPLAASDAWTRSMGDIDMSAEAREEEKRRKRRKKRKDVTRMETSNSSGQSDILEDAKHSKDKKSKKKSKKSKKEKKEKMERESSNDLDSSGGE